MVNSWKPRFHELEHESKMRLQPTPTPLNGKATKPAKYVNKMKARPSVESRNEWSTKAIAMPPTTGGKARKMHGEAKSEYQKRKEKNKEDAKNHLNLAHNSGNASCATNEWPGHPDQLQH